MASRSIGVLTLDLIARIGGWSDGMNKAARIADQKTKEIEKSFSKLGGFIKGALGGLSAGLVINKIIDETSKAEKVMAQLESVVAATGQAAGFTVPELFKMSEELKKVSVFGGKAIRELETILLGFTNIRGDEFTAALQASVDIAARLNKDLSQVGLTLGKALQQPAEGFAGLKREGVLLSDATEKLIKDMIKLGDVSGAQRVIIDELNKTYKGAAAAARNTLGGALGALKGAYDALFRLDRSQTAGIVDAINLLANNLESIAKVATRAAIAYGIFKAALIGFEFAKIIRGHLQLFAAVASGRAVFIDATTTLARDTIAKEIATLAALEMANAEGILAGALLGRARAAVVAAGATGASEAVMATNLRNLAGAEKNYAQAQAAVAIAQAQAAGSTARLDSAYAKLRANNTRLGGTLNLILAPFRSLFALISRHPIGALITAVVGATIALSSFADKIKVSKDGVVTLSDVAQATFEELRRVMQPVVDFFRDIGGYLKDFAKNFEDVFRAIKEVGGEAFEILFVGLQKIIPGFGLIVALGEKFYNGPLKRIMERAREIAEERERLGKIGPGAGDVIIPPTFDPAALDKIKEMIAALEQQIDTFDASAEAIIRYRITQGDLVDDFKKAGAGADIFKQQLIDLTVRLEQLQKAKVIKGVIEDLEKQIALFGLGEDAAFAYSLAHGELAKALEGMGNGAEFARARLVDLNAQLEAKKIAEKLKDINIQILELQGNTAEVIRLKFEADFGELIKQLEKIGDVEGLKLVQKLKDLTLQQAAFNEQLEAAGKITEDLAITEERIRNSREAGAISEFDMLGKLSVARQGSVEDLEEILAILEKLPGAASDPKLIQSIEAFKNQIEALRNESNLLGDQIESELKESFAAAFADFVKGTATAREAWNSFVDSIRNTFIQKISQMFAENLFGGLSELFKPGGSGSFGSFFKGLFGFASGGYLKPGQVGVAGEHGKSELIFGGQSGLSILSHKRSMELFQQMARNLPTRDFGGRGYPGQSVIINPSAGPEVFTPVTAGKFTPRVNLGGETNNHFNFSINAPNGTVSRATQMQIAAAAAKGATQSLRRNG